MNWLLHFFSYPADALLLSGDYDPGLVLLSLLIAIFTSTIAIRLAWSGQRATVRSEQRLMLFGSSLALGGGVWAMHFIGMLAFQLCTPVSYDPWHTALSLVPSVAASAVAMSLLTAQQISFSKLVVGGVLVGAGIGTMHYWGMAAMQMAPVLRYDPLMFAASILTAVLLAMLALWPRQVALYHHEKWDGSGYPYGLAAEAIPLEGRIVALADVFDALTSVRPYKKAWSVEQAMVHIHAQSGLHFDPTLVQLFAAQLPQLLQIKQQWAEQSDADQPLPPG